MNKVIDVRIVKLYENLDRYRIYIDTKYCGDFAIDLEKKIVRSRSNWTIETIFDLLEDVHIRNEATSEQKRKMYKNYLAFLEKYTQEEYKW